MKIKYNLTRILVLLLAVGFKISFTSDQPKNYVIRRATLQDSEGLLNLYRRVAAIPGGLAREESEITDRYINTLLTNGINRGLALVAESNGVIIGSIIKYKLEPKVFSHVLTEGSILVHPDFQGRGIGSSIIRAFLRDVQEHYPDVLRVEIIARESNPAISLYERLGFVREGRLEGRIRGVSGSLEADIPMAWFNPTFLLRVLVCVMLCKKFSLSSDH